MCAVHRRDGCLQVIEYTLLPLYDPSIPLESFMSPAQARKFRSALRGATEAAWSSFVDCTNRNCTRGHCTPVFSDNMKTSLSGYTCVPSGSVQDGGPAPLSAAAFARDMSQRDPLAMSALPTLPSIHLLQVRHPVSRTFDLCWLCLSCGMHVSCWRKADTAFPYCLADFVVPCIVYAMIRLAGRAQHPSWHPASRAARHPHAQQE